MTFDWAERIAAALDVAPAELLGPRAQITHVAGYVGAGAEVIPFDDHPQGSGLDAVLCPQGLNPEKTVAVRVRGDSMAPLVQDGWLLFYSRDPEAELSQVLGKTCIVKLLDGRMLVKQVRRGPVVGRFNLHSINAPVMEDISLEWASPVRMIVPADLADATDIDLPVDKDEPDDAVFQDVAREIEKGLRTNNITLSSAQMDTVISRVYEKVLAGERRAAKAGKKSANSQSATNRKNATTKRI